MVVDSSALLAILLQEPVALAVANAMRMGSQRFLSAANLLEASMVIEGRKGDAGARDLDRLLFRAAIEIVSVDRDQAELARSAWRRFGKGRHPAGLNYGDCFAYALAKQSSLPLLFVGNDFNRTDIATVPLGDAVS